MENKTINHGRPIIENGVLIDYEVDLKADGYCYKNREAFQSGNGVCYISEAEYNELQSDLTALQAEYEKSDMSDEDYQSDRKHLLENAGWTRNKLIELCGGPGFEKLAEEVFLSLEWQSPETYMNEMVLTEEDLPRLGLTKEQVNKAWGHDYFTGSRKKPISAEEAREKLLSILDKEDFGDRVYEFAQSLFQSGINVIETKNAISDEDPHGDMMWYDDVQEEFYQKVYDKTLAFLQGKS